MMVKWSLAGARALAREKKVRASDLLYMLVAFTVFTLPGCAGSSSIAGVSSVTETTTAVPPISTPLPSASPTLAPTATIEPTATATLAATATVEPTATPVPPLAIQPDGFQVWCAPVEYEGTRPHGPDAPDYARQMSRPDGLYLSLIHI